MIISLSWLRELVSVQASAQEIADKLSVSGLEVEHLDVWESVKGGLQGFVIGQVVDCAKHPNADKLSITKVDIGNGELQPIVCGAPNVAAGQKVVVATVGTDVTVPGKGSFTIGEAKIRGEVSRGMICAEDETGLGTSHDGIIVLPEDAPVGMQAAEYFKVVRDDIMEIGLTANRGDAASHLGVARDVAALFDTEIKLPQQEILETVNSDFQITVEDKLQCTRYVGLEIKNVKITASPEWMQQRLRAIGIEPKNIVVDATNYVLHELGQPLHAFDSDKLQGKTIAVRQAREGETLITLDKTERKLSNKELLISDASGPIAFAGVMGGLSTAVNENTSNLFIESAHFQAGLVRKAAKAHQLNTDAAFRFERGTDIEMCRFAAFRAAGLIVQYGGGEIGGIVDHYPEKYTPVLMTISLKKLDAFTGTVLPKNEVLEILKNLGYAPVEKDSALLEVKIPSWAMEMKTEADIYEEILRIYGYDRIPFSGKMNASLPVFNGFSGFKKQEHAARFLTANGFFEVMNNSLSSVAYYDEKAVARMVAINNPLSSDMGYLRASMLPGLLQAAAYNRNRKNHNIRFFEFGRTYESGEGGIAETEELALLFGGARSEESWEEKPVAMDFYYGKALVQNLMQTLGMPIEAAFTLRKVEGAMLQQFDLQGEFWYATLPWPNVLAAASQFAAPKVLDPPKFPYMRRDLSLVVERTLPFSELKKVIDEEKVALLKQMRVFDVFEGRPLDEGKKAVAIAFYLGAEDGTLTDEIADSAMKKLMKAFENKGAVIRK